MRRAIVVRTHYIDEALERQIAALLAIGDVLVVADESTGPIDIRSAPKIGLTPQCAHAQGLYTAVPRLFWRCGDYSLYAARQWLAERDFIWMIEPDVRLARRDMAAFFDHFDGGCAADLLAARVRPADPAWDWAATMRDRDAAVWQCLFPLVRLSGTAIDFLFNVRRADSRAMIDNAHDDGAHVDLGDDAWPNDEAFTATTLARNGYRLADFNDDGDHYTDATFSFWNAVAASTLARQATDDLIYHPVLSGVRLFEKLLYIAHCSNDYATLEDKLVALTGEEWTDAQAAYYRAVIAQTRGGPA